MTLHLLCERDVGLFSLIQQVVAHLPWARGAGRVPIALFGRRCAYWLEGGYRGGDSVWEYYFEPLDPEHPAASVPEALRERLADRPPDPRDVGLWLTDDAFASSQFGDHPKLKGKTLSIPYGWDDPSPQLREEAARWIAKSIRPRAWIREAVDAFTEEQLAGHRVVGVQVRGTDAISGREDRAHRKDSLVLDHYREEIETSLEGAGDARLFVATDDERSLAWLRDAFGDRVFAHDSHRHAGGEAAGRGPTGNLMPAYVAGDPTLAARNGGEAVIESLLLGRCDHLVHNGSSLARTVLLTNPRLSHVNANRKSRLVAHAQTLSWKKIRRNMKRAIRRINPLRARGLDDV